jgi:CHAD domain-containing protein
VSELHRHEVRLHSDLGAAHGFRIEARRLRSIVSGYAPFFEPSSANDIRADLRRAGAAFGVLRDSQMLHERLTRLLADELEGDDGAVVRRQVGNTLESTGDPESISHHLESTEYDAFARRLDRFTDLPPWTPIASEDAQTSLLPQLEREWRRFRSRNQLARTAVGDDQNEELHEARKSAKRTRYVFETAIPVFGRPARRMAKAARRVQHVLGEHQDSVLAQGTLARVRAESVLRGEDVSILDRLHQREAALAAQLREDFLRLVTSADRRRLRTWMR